MSVISEKTFCVLPWIHSFVNSNGNYQICCTAEEHHPGIPDNNNNLYNIKNRPSPEEIMNSAFMNKARKDMLNGVWNKACTRCLVTESTAGTSRRMIENLHYNHLVPELIKQTNEDGSLKKIKFKSIDYRLGNLCNLECRMCGPHSSNKWIKDWNSVKPESEQMSPERRIEVENYDWIEKDYLLTEFKEKLIDAEHLHFAGGEPLFTPQMATMLKYCIDLGVAQNIILTYNTNATKLPMPVLELWKQFKGIRLLCSIDGFGKVNEYIRYPSKWDVIDKNLTFLDDNFEAYKIQEIILSCTVQIYNVLALTDLYNYLKKFKNIIPALNLVNLHYPEYLLAKLLPTEAKQLATMRLLQVASDLNGKLSDKYQYLEENIHQIINFMNESDKSNLLPLFTSVNSKIDKAKGIEFGEYIPELKAVITQDYFKKQV